MKKTNDSPVTRGDVKKIFKIMLWVMVGTIVIMLTIGIIQYSAQRNYIQNRLGEEYKR